MKRKPIRVDWDALVEAFHASNDDLVYYLDLVTGNVVLEGEEEGEDFEDEDFEQAAVPSVPVDDSIRAYIRPLDTPRKLEWMRTFLDEGGHGSDDEAVAALRVAADDPDPAGALGAALQEHAEARDRWYLYRAERTQGVIDAWLHEHEVELVDPPPWARGRASG